MKEDIYLSKDQCLDCKAFQEQVKEITGIDFNIGFLPAQKLALQQKGYASCEPVYLEAIAKKD